MGIIFSKTCNRITFLSFLLINYFIPLAESKQIENYPLATVSVQENLLTNEKK